MPTFQMLDEGFYGPNVMGQRARHCMAPTTRFSGDLVADRNLRCGAGLRAFAQAFKFGHEKVKRPVAELNSTVMD